MPSEKTVERLSLYRYLLQRLLEEGERFVHSHRLARLALATAAQVRHDLMAIGYTGRPNQGYDISKLLDSIGEFLDTPLGRNIALVGVGDLGRAILSDFTSGRPRMSIVAAFDIDPGVVGRVISGCRCYSMDSLDEEVRSKKIGLAVLAVPAVAAQEAAERLYDAGVMGLLNFAPIRLRVPEDVYVADVNITIALEKVAYFASRKFAVKGEKNGDNVPESAGGG